LAAPNIIKMIEVSEADDLPFMAMERLVGDDLATLLTAKPVWTEQEVVDVMVAVAAGLDAAHAAGVIHRDLKPANLFASRSDIGVIWKVLDFGVAKASGDDATQTSGNIVGTPGYMAPEQARGEAIDKRADIYSLAVIAYRMLTGRPVVVPGDLPGMIHEVVFKMPPAPSQFATITREAEACLLIGLSKTPSLRFDSAGAFADALKVAAAGPLPSALLSRAATAKSRNPWDRWLRAATERE
jgi:serine/threonine protein kinase